MTVNSSIGSRHLMPSTYLKDAADSTASTVHIIVSADWATSTAGQLLTSCLVNLLCRQDKIVTAIYVEAADSALVIKLPSGSTSLGFPACLEGLGEWAVGNAVPVLTQIKPTTADHIVIIGETVACSQAIAGHKIYAYGDGWLAWVGSQMNIACPIFPQSHNPLGPFLAAALVSSEIFKLNRGTLRGAYLASNGFSLWTGKTSGVWGDLENGPELVGCQLNIDALHIIGMGAVGNDLAYVISNVNLKDPYIIAIDHDSYDETNLNRCLLAGRVDIGARKVDTIETVLKNHDIPVYPFFGTIRDYIVGSKINLRSDVRSKVDNFAFDAIASCVDRGSSRQDIQSLWPTFLAGGSTLDLTAKSNSYNVWPGAMCLACFNPAEQDGEEIRAVENKLRQMTQSQRHEFAIQNGLPSAAIEEYIQDKKCGTLGETALKDFATKPNPEFSVGFVSLGAALLLSATIFKQLIPEISSSPVADQVTLNFLNGGFMETGMGFDKNCELKCTTVPTRKNKTA